MYNTQYQTHEAEAANSLLTNAYTKFKNLSSHDSNIWGNFLFQCPRFVTKVTSKLFSYFWIGYSLKLFRRLKASCNTFSPSFLLLLTYPTLIEFFPFRILNTSIWEQFFPNSNGIEVLRTFPSPMRTILILLSWLSLVIFSPKHWSLSPL